MIATLDEYMNSKASNTQRNSIPTLNDYMNNGEIQQNVVTPRITPVSQNNPQAVSSPSNNKVSIGEGLGNLGSAIAEGVGNFAQEVASNPLEYAKNTANSLVVNPVKEFATNVFNPDANKRVWGAIGGGVAKGAISLPQNIWNLGVDAVNAYNATPEQNQYKAHYVEDIANALQGNQLYQDLYQKPKQANPAIAELSSFAAPMAAVGKVAKTANAIQTANKVAKESTRIASKLNDVQKAKYASQIQKLAQKNVANNVVPASKASQLANNVGTGAFLGSLEGETMQEKAANAAGMATLGTVLHGGHRAIKAVSHTKPVQNFQKNVKASIANLTEESPLASQVVAGLDTSFNTNMSDSASEMTKLRKEAYKKLSKSQNYKRYATEEELSTLEKAGQFSEEAEKQQFEVNKRGMREAAFRKAKEIKDAKRRAQEQSQTIEPDYTTPKEADKFWEDLAKSENKTVKSPEETEQWFKDREETTSSESDLTGVKSKTDINTPNDIKTPQNEPSKRPQSKQSDKIKQRINELEKELDNNKEFLEEENHYEPKDWDKYEKDSAELSRLKEELKKAEYDESIKESIKESEKTESSNMDKFGDEDSWGVEETEKLTKSKLKNNQYIDEDGNVVTRLESGAAEGAKDSGSFYKRSANEIDENGNVIKEDIYKDVEPEKETGRTSSLSYPEETIDELMKKYKVMPDGETIVYKSGKKANRPVPEEELYDLRERLRKEEKEPEEYVRDEEYEDTYDKYNDKNINEIEEEAPIQRYKTNDPEFIEWYDRYSKATEDAKDYMLKKKLDSINSKKDLDDFSRKFVEQENRDNSFARAKNIGDEYYDTSDVSETKKLTKAEETVGKEYEPEEKVEEQQIGRSPDFKKKLKFAWRNNIHETGTLYAKGKLYACRDSASAQKAYDNIVKRIESSKESADIKSAMIEDLNNIADRYMEDKKDFGNTIKKVDIKASDIKKRAISDLEQANESGDLASGKQVIDTNNMQYKYTDHSGKKAMQEHYIQSTEKAYEQFRNLGLEEKRDANGNKYYEINKGKALEWAKEQSKLKNGWNANRLKKDLARLEKDPNLAIIRAKEAAKDILSKNRSILTNDILYAFDKPQKTLKEIEGAKGTEKRWQYEETGDTWNRESSDVNEGQRKARETISGIEKAIEETDVTALAKNYDKLSKKTILDNEFSWKAIDSEYIRQSGKESVPISELPSTTFKEVKKIDAFDKAKGDISKLDVGEFSNKNYAKYGENEYLKKYAEDYPDSQIEVREDKKHSNPGGGFDFNSTNMIFYNTFKGTKSFDYIVKHEYRHAQQYKDKANYKLFKELAEITNDFEDYQAQYSDVLEEISKSGIKFYCKKDGSLSKITLNKLERDFGEVKKEIYKEWYNRAYQYVNHILEKDANNFAKGIDNGTISEQLRTTVRDSRNNVPRTNARTRTNSKGKGSELSKKNGEGEEVKFITSKMLDWFDNTKHKSADLYKKIKDSILPEVKDVSKVFKTLNDEREQFFREFGTYTDERMRNRLFQQAESGEGVYFQQMTKDDGKVHFGKESNDKVGFTGEKKFEGLSQKGTTQQSLLRGFEDRVKREHTRDVINFYKENFSEQREGTIPVNSKLLANTMYFGKSKAFYETIRKGKEAIDATFDEKNAKQWKELYDTTDAGNADIYLPKDLLDFSIVGDKEYALDYMKTYGKKPLSKNWIKGVGKISGALLDFYTDRFKRKVLTSMSFFANNRFGNQIMLAANADNPMEYLKGIANAFKLKDTELPTEILESTLADCIKNEASGATRKYFSEKVNNFDNIVRILDGKPIATEELSTVAGKATAHVVNVAVGIPNAIFKTISEKMGNLNEAFERFERKQAFSQTLSKMQKQKVLTTAKQMVSVQELAKVAKENKIIRQAVIDKVADILGDYNNFSKFEKNVMKKIIPFYAWNRTITRHIIQLAKDNPVRATLIAIETYKLLNQDDGLEEYQHGALKTNMKNKRTNSNVVLNKANMIPYNTLFEMLDPDNIGSVNNMITKPMEAVRGEKFFLNSELTSKNYKRMSYKGKKGYLNIKTGEFKEGGAPLSVRAGYLTKDAYETVYPMAGSPLTKGSVDAVKHYAKTGEVLFPDKQYDANLGGFYHGDYAGTSKTGKKYAKKERSAKNRLDFKYQVANRLTGLGIQPEHQVDKKEQKAKYQRQRDRMKKRKSY